MQKKALYVRFKGIPEGVIFFLSISAKTLISKEFYVIARKEVSLPLRKQGKQSLLTSRPDVSRRSFYEK